MRGSWSGTASGWLCHLLGGPFVPRLARERPACYRCGKAKPLRTAGGRAKTLPWLLPLSSLREPITAGSVYTRAARGCKWMTMEREANRRYGDQPLSRLPAHNDNRYEVFRALEGCGPTRNSLCLNRASPNVHFRAAPLCAARRPRPRPVRNPTSTRCQRQSGASQLLLDGSLRRAREHA